MITSTVSNKTHKYEPFSDEEFKRTPSADGISSLIMSHYLLGDVSGMHEWEHPDKARNTFVHLSAYEHFINDEQLMLLGRTGSGKSAIIYSLKDDIEKGKIKNYTDVIQIDEKNFCEKLADLCYSVDINRFDATNKITNAIVISMYTTVMIYCVEKFHDKSHQLVSIINYLSNNGFMHTKKNNALEVLSELTSESFEKEINTIYKSDRITNAFAIARILAKMRKMAKSDDEIQEENGDFLKALSELGVFLSENDKKVLILLDSFDEYRINDKAFVVAIKSLIMSCFRIFNSSGKNRIYFKMALASETYTRVLTHLPAQNQTNTVAILWSFKELMIAMALRLVSWYCDPEANYKDKKCLFSFLDKYSIDDIKASKTAYKVAEEIFYNFLPRICKTNSSYTFLTLAFISRHTMKKPREILQIFNAIMDRIIFENNVNYFLDDNGSFKIKDVVHSLQNDFIEQTLSLYKVFIPKIGDYIQTLLYGSKFIFAIDKDFDDKLKKVDSLVQSDVKDSEYLSYFDKLDILSIIFETGLLGRVSQVRTINAKYLEQFGTEMQIKIINALFEYQFKGKLMRNPEMQYVIHPMCYEHFNCEVGMRSMVNTDSYDTTELLFSIISEE